jgi:hypothetical protein
MLVVDRDKVAPLSGAIFLAAGNKLVFLTSN